MTDKTRNIDNSEKPILFFDGLCGLCNSSVDQFLKMDKKGTFMVAPLQGVTAEKYGVNPGDTDPDSIILYHEGVFYYRSAAVLKTLGLMGGLPALAGVFYIVPNFIRDAVYKFIARNRYKWFGKKETCRIPTPEERKRFLD